MIDPRREKIEYAVKKYIKDKNLVTQNDNIIDVTKACMAASVLRYCLAARFEKKITNTQLSKFFKALDDYRQDKTHLFWEDGILKFTRLVTINDVQNAETPEENEEEPESPRAA